MFATFLCEAKDTSRHKVRITVKNEDPKSTGQIMKVEFFEDYSFYGNWPVSKSYELRLTESQMQKKLEYFGQKGYIVISFSDSYGGTINGRPIFFQGGDDVKMILKNGRIVFEGPGSTKYNCQVGFYNVGISTRSTGFKGKLDSVYLSRYMEDFDAYTNDRLVVLDKYKSSLTANVYTILKSNIEYTTEQIRLSNLRTFFKNDLSKEEKEIIYFYLFKYTSECCTPLTGNVGVNSCSFFDYLLMREIVIVDLANYRKIITSKFRFLYDNILQHYSGTTRDRLLTSSILGQISFRDSTDFYRSNAFNLVQESFSKSALKSNMKLFSSGTPAFNFKLQDSTGHYIKMSDFRGKIVILDFYFNGCHGCANLAKGMDEVIHKFGSNPNVAFISISIDKKLEVFKNAVKSGKYTNAASVNLYTNGFGENHELIKHYQIQGYPFLLIVDPGGNILDSNPPYPNFGEGFTKKFINIIESELLKIGSGNS